MHELLAPILWAVECDAIKNGSSALRKIGNGEDEAMHEILDERYVEHDTFTLFSILMQTAKPSYEHSDNVTSPVVAQEHSPIVKRSKYIHEVLLGKVDPQLADHLQSIEILPQIFLM